MAFPTKNEILVGIAFVFVGLVHALCDKWQSHIKEFGAENEHTFNHLFLMWTLKQFLQLSLIVVWIAIDKNWLPCGIFKHGKQELPDPQVNTYATQNQNENQAFRNNNAELHDGNGHIPVNFPYDNNQDTDDQLIINEVQAEDLGEDMADDQALINLGNHQPKKFKNKKASFFVYLPPAIFAQSDVLLMYFGLNLTYGSSFIMFKGTAAFFTALLVVAFLAQQFAYYVWLGVIVTTVGFSVAGISDYIKIPPGGFETYGVAAGDLLIVMAQIAFATKIVYEEKFIRKYSVHPMKFLGSEAIFGITFAASILLVFSLVDAVQYSELANGKLEDIADAVYQFHRSYKIILAVLGSLISYIMYIYFGLLLVKVQGALARIMIETFVWILYWAICLVLDWEHFYIVQVPALCMVAIGTLIYSHILVLPFSSHLEGINNKDNTNLQNDFFVMNQPTPNEEPGPSRLAPDELPQDGAPDNRDYRTADQGQDTNVKVVADIHLNDQLPVSGGDFPDDNDDDVALVQA